MDLQCSCADAEETWEAPCRRCRRGILCCDFHREALAVVVLDGLPLCAPCYRESDGDAAVLSEAA